jgi:hypothetical protein
MPRSIARGSTRTSLWFAALHLGLAGPVRSAGRMSAPRVWLGSEGIPEALICRINLLAAPEPARMAPMLSASSRRLQSLQFGAAHLAEGAQRINRIAAYKFSQFRKRLVRCEICLDNCLNDCLKASDHVRARQNTHLVYQSADADQRRNLRLVVSEGVGVRLGCLTDEMPVQFFPLI